MDRIQVNFGGGKKPESDAGRTITLFLSLYLLVLAFFILLVSISSTEEVKSKALMESLTSTFSSVLPPRMDLTAFNATTGEFLAADDFQRQVTGLFSTVIGVVQVETIQPGRIMRIEMDGDGLFELDKDVIREGQYGFMDRLVAALSANPPGLRFEMEFVVPAPWTGIKTLPTDQSLPVRRAGAFARDLLSRGAPPGSVSIGLRGGGGDNVEIWFHIRAQEENRIRFEDSPLIKVSKAKEEATPVRKAPVTLLPQAPVSENKTPSSSLLLAPLPENQEPAPDALVNPAEQTPVVEDAPLRAQPLSLRPTQPVGGAQ